MTSNIQQFVTNKDLQLTKGLYSAIPNCIVDVPKGSKVQRRPSNPDEYYIDPCTFPPNSIDRHDATYYGFVVNSEDVEEVN